ncbi:2734_t:CDS:2 [Funneliformis caledonium]|uniref:2734_t:CDS:1 n=1 Tax=Funneliformis caledonium TaxID=1117310 RepID=A0A9N9CQY6_9GLOM|nr:2734_t:CDS:2 [Funneliformis caledonium]
MSSSNNKLLLLTMFSVGFLIGGAVGFVGVNQQQQQHQIHDIENDQEQEIDDDDITVVNCKFYNKQSYLSSHHTSFPSPHSSLSNSPTSSVIPKLHQLHIHQKELYKKQQTLHSYIITFNHKYTCLLTETNVFKGYSCLQMSKSKEKLDLLQQKIKCKGKSVSDNINGGFGYILEIKNYMKMQMAEMKWLEQFKETYEEKLENSMKELDKMKEEFNEFNANPVIHRRRHRKIRRSSGINAENKEQDGENEFCTINPISNSTYENSTPSFVPLSASIQSAPPSPPHFKTPSRIVPTNYGSEIKLKLMTTEDKVLRSSNIRERYMKYRPTISSRLNPVRRCELGLRSSVGVLSPRYLSDVKMDTGYNEDV